MKILIINAHPNPESFCKGIADTYCETLKNQGKQYTRIDLGELQFNPDLHFGYQKESPLEEDLQKAQSLIEEADHLVWIFPLWWANMPAILKGFIDRVFLPGWAFKYRPGKALPEQLLKGKTSEVFVTMNSPIWYFKLFMRDPVHNAFVRGTLRFCGIKNVSTQYFGPIKNSSDSKKAVWLDKVRKRAVW